MGATKTKPAMGDYESYKKLIDDHILDYIPDIDQRSETIYEAMKYSLTAGGKRVRPVLLLAACEFAGGSVNEALPYACAVEYIHTYSLIHDDLPAMDNDDLRRGKPTNHKVYGAGIATLAGDGLLNTAYEIMPKNMMLYFGDSKELIRRIKAMFTLAKAAGVRGMVAGQVSDIENEGRRCSREMLEYIDANKTGALITGSVKAGLYLGGADDDTMNHMSKYAECLGASFQIVDDILDVIGTAEELGKNPHVDEERNKNTFVTVMGLEKAEECVRTLNEEAAAALEPYGERADFFRRMLSDLANRTK